MARLTKTRTVMELLAVGEEAARFEDDDGERAVEMARSTWDDLGGPTEVTVTVEPGDLLNMTTVVG